MRHIITILLTAALVLMTKVAFSQSIPENSDQKNLIPIGTFQNPDERDNAIIAVEGNLDKSTTRYTIESAVRIKHREVKRVEKAADLRIKERNLPPIERSDYNAIERSTFDNEICIPVVFNIIHDSAAYNTPFNPADEDIEVLFDLLNEQFSEYVSNDPSIPSSPETGITFVWGIDGSPGTSIRRFDRYDPANEYIVYGDPNDDSDDWPETVPCGSTGVGSFSLYQGTENYQSRIAYNPENTLNIYMVQMPTGVSSYTFSPWNPSPNKDFGVWLSTGGCLSNLGYSGPIGGYSLSANYAMLDEGMNSSYYAKFRKTISASVGHYLGLLKTYQAPDPEIVSQFNWNTGPGSECTVETNPWEAVISLGYFDLYNPGTGPEGGYSQCEYHGDGCCDTPWSSSLYSPLVVGGDLCAHNDPSALYSNNTDPTTCELAFMGMHLQYESVNRLNVMNYSGFCDRYFFTEDQIARMHDMTNVFRSGVISAGATLCLSGDIEQDPIFGCIDPIACNYSETAEVNNGTCYYDCCPECIWDYNGNGVIELSDLLQFLTVNGTNCPE